MFLLIVSALFFRNAVYTCPALTVPSNGIKFGCPENATMYNDTVCQFSCNDGYIGSGSQARRCQFMELGVDRISPVKVCITHTRLTVKTKTQLKFIIQIEVNFNNAQEPITRR